MNTAVINIKVEPIIKKKAKKVTEELGLSLSAVVNGYLRHLIKTKTVHFSLNEQPSEYMIEVLRRSEEDIKKGRVVSFKSPKDALSYLDKIIDEQYKKS